MTAKLPNFVVLIITASLALCISAKAAAPASGAGRAPRNDAAAARQVARNDRIANRGNDNGPIARGENADKRQDHQQKRIEQGVKKGQLTPDEITVLKTQEQSIQALQDSFKADGKLSKDEAKQLRKALNDASLQIWAQRHDTQGNQKAVSRLGKDIVAQDGLTTQIESGDITKAQARVFLADFHKMTTLKRRLGADNIPDEQRAKLQTQYNDLLNKYFLTK